MKIYNRNFEVIQRAHEKRVMKMRLWQAHSAKSAGASKTKTSGTQSKSSSAAVRNGSAVQQLLSRLSQSAGTTTEQIAANRSRSYDYGIAEVAAQRVAGHMDRFLAEGEESLYGAGDASREALEQEISSFVDDYNIAVKKLSSAGSTEDKVNVQSLVKAFSGRAADLKKLGITVNANGTLDFDRKILKEADTEAIKKVFGAENGVSAKLKAAAKEAEEGAAKQADVLIKSGYTASSVYNRYAADEGSYGTTGSRYQAKG